MEFNYRISFPLDEAFGLSLDSPADNEAKKGNPGHFSWQCDQSDLGSINSSIFKHSLHQSSLERSNTLLTDSTKIISRADIHADGAADNEKLKSQSSNNINEDAASGITIIEIKDRKHSSGPTSSVISYDSIYLSSESDRQTVLGDNIDEQIKDFEDIIKELSSAGEQGAESIIDNLYGQVAKGKAEVKSVEPKLNLDTLSKYTDYISKGTLERLTILTGGDCADKNRRTCDYHYASLPDAGISELLRDCELIDANLRDDASVRLLEPFPDYDTVSGDANDIEDARVYDANGALGTKTADSSIKSTAASIDENEKGAPSIELVRQPTKERIDSAPSQDTVKGSNTTKIYLPEIGVEFDYENSIASFESDRDFESPPPPPESACKPQILNLVTITGRKVIVDEFAAKVERQSTRPVAKEPQSVDASAATARSRESETKKYFNQDKQPKAELEQKAANNSRNAKIKVSESKHKLVDSADKAVSGAEIPETALQSASDAKSYRLLRRNCLSFNMPRPQLLTVIDSKNSAPKKDQRSGKKKADVRVESDKGGVLNQTEREFLHKVDSVRNYWSKLVDDGRDGDVDRGSNLKQMSKNFLSSKSSNDIPEALKSEDFQSFFPTVEIVELNGETKAALVTSRKLNDVEFDHVRYKVMKSDMFQKNLLVSNRKETQFDGLMQYLHDYSFQELLANNNVVIIEPVRTKVEKITEQPNKAQSAACKITNGAGNRNGSNNLKKHFFYHPIRVNKELYEEELPVPDTVRNVRKLFEGSLKRRSAKPDDDAKLSDATRKTIRYLAIDTSFDNNNLAVSKWDSISLSSGVSSAADLNSPCDCHESTNKDIKFVCSSKENLDSAAVDEDDDDEFKSHFVSDDVMEKIRECGSSITYYGGQTLDTKTNSDLMTKAIMKEISSQKCHCQSKRPRAQHEKPIRKLSNDYSGE